MAPLPVVRSPELPIPFSPGSSPRHPGLRHGECRLGARQGLLALFRSVGGRPPGLLPGADEGLAFGDGLLLSDELPSPSPGEAAAAVDSALFASCNAALASSADFAPSRAVVWAALAYSLFSACCCAWATCSAAFAKACGSSAGSFVQAAPVACQFVDQAPSARHKAHQSLPVVPGGSPRAGFC